jgi:hypothetical protein
MDNSDAVGADNGQDLADLVWKYFSEEINQAEIEVQEALAPRTSISKKKLLLRKVSKGRGRMTILLMPDIRDQSSAFYREKAAYPFFKALLFVTADRRAATEAESKL